MDDLSRFEGSLTAFLKILYEKIEVKYVSDGYIWFCPV